MIHIVGRRLRGHGDCKMLVTVLYFTSIEREKLPIYAKNGSVLKLIKIVDSEDPKNHCEAAGLFFKIKESSRSSTWGKIHTM